jgi:hypothetical protein
MIKGEIYLENTMIPSVYTPHNTGLKYMKKTETKEKITNSTIILETSIPTFWHLQDC